MQWPFEAQRSYNRAADIHGRFGGQQRHGISTPKNAPGIFLFTGSGGEKVGYADRWLPDGTFRYTGRGPTGPQTMDANNRAIRDHVINGKDLLLFEKPGSGKPVKFLGLFACSGWEYETQPGQDGVLRQAIVFTLTPLSSIEAQPDIAAPEIDAPVDLAELRRRAFAAATSAPQTGSKTSSTVYSRSADVRRYVLARADGTCEACDEPAPFTTAAGEPYLEPHHIRRLSDGGPDDPRFVAGVCPNCHRRAHHSADRVQFNSTLLARVQHIEASSS